MLITIELYKNEKYKNILGAFIGKERVGHLMFDYDVDNNLWLTFLHVEKKYRGSNIAIQLLQHFKGLKKDSVCFYAHVASQGVLKLCKRVFGPSLSEVVLEEGKNILDIPKKSYEYVDENGVDSVYCDCTYQVQFLL